MDKTKLVPMTRSIIATGFQRCTPSFYRFSNPVG
jgi:hypothetical protein